MHCRRWTAGQVILGVTNVAIFCVSASEHERPLLGRRWRAGASSKTSHELGRRAWDHL